MNKILRSRIMSPTGKPIIVDAVWPNEGVQVWYWAQLDKTITQMYVDMLRVIVPALRDTPVVVASDEAPPNAAGIIFRNGSRVLLVKRTDSFAQWAFPGGGIEHGESSEQAARREVWEELQHIHRGPIKFLHVQRFRHIRYAVYLAESESFAPTLNHEHNEYRWVDPATAVERFDIHPGTRMSLQQLLNSESADYASDAVPTTALSKLLDKWGKQWIQKFDLMSKTLSVEFASKSGQATQVSMAANFKRAGFTIPFRPTRSVLNAYRVVAAEQVGLIRSIPQKFLTEVQTIVWESVKRGGDLKTLSQRLEKQYGVTRRRAALIARDQNAKAKEIIEDARLMELGVRQAIWMHSHAGKEPRPTHVAMNNKLYEIAKGMYDPDPQVRRNIRPGELIQCRCAKRIYIPGFEDPLPEWDTVQT